MLPIPHNCQRCGSQQSTPQRFRYTCLMRDTARILLCLALLVGLETGILAQDTPEDEIEYRILKFGNDLTVFEDGLTPRLRVRANFYRGKAQNP